jgi:hypothetical protein
VNSIIQTTFILLLFAHLVGDILFNCHKLAVLKRSANTGKQLGGLIIHCAIHSFLSGGFLLLSDRLWLKGGLLVFAAHFFIDLNRSRVEINLYGPNRVFMTRSEFFAWISGKTSDSTKINIKSLISWFTINFLDQGFHLGSLYCIALVV